MCFKKSYNDKIYKRPTGFQFCVQINQNISKLFLPIDYNQNFKIMFALRLRPLCIMTKYNNMYILVEFLI